MSKGVVVSTCSPADEVRGSVLRLRVLVNNLDQTDKWVFCPSVIRSGVSIVDGINVRYFPLTTADFCMAFLLLLQGWPITNIIFQRRDIAKNQKGVEKFVFHLSRTVQRGKFSGDLTVDLCESLADNYRLRAALMPFFSIKRLFFIIEAKRLFKFELALAKNRLIATQFISENDSLIAKAENFSILPNSIANRPFRKTSYIFHEKRIVFIGQLDYEPNLYSIIKTSKFLNEIDSSYELHVVGSFNKSTEKKLCKFYNIFMHGFVDNLAEIIPQSLCGVALIDNGTGMQNKVLDYFFYGIPTLVSQDVYDGLPPGSPALIVTDVDNFNIALQGCSSLDTRNNLEMRSHEYLKKLNETECCWK